MPKLFLCAAARQAACPNESQLNVVTGRRVTAAPAKKQKNKNPSTSGTALRLQEACTDIRRYLPRFVHIVPLHQSSSEVSLLLLK